MLVVFISQDVITNSSCFILVVVDSATSEIMDCEVISH